MITYQAPVDDMLFLLAEVFATQVSVDNSGAQVDRDTMGDILEQAGKFASREFFPLNASGDALGCSFDGTSVKTPQGFVEAYKKYAQAGWCALSGDPEFGGMGMPKIISALVDEIMQSANCALATYSMLTVGFCLAISHYGKPAVKKRFLPQMYKGQWSGTMVLTEPQAGSDLGLIRSRAEPCEEDGGFTITGSKIFITAGEHDLTENIVHLVLAKLPKAPTGSKGISLFLVPKILSDDKGRLKEKNTVHCMSIENKMGMKGSATCVLQFEKARGFLLGAPNDGLKCMFTMMNYERLMVGVQGVALAQMSYQRAKAYAKTRLQGRSLTTKKTCPIIEHGDVRRMLTTMAVNVEAGRAFVCYVASKLDCAKNVENKAARDQAQKIVSLLTPVAKGFLTDMGFEACVLGQQILGGYGYISESGQEQLVRDVRITQIYEGTNGIQAMDLIGRKTLHCDGALLAVFVAEVEDFCKRQTAAMAPFTTPLLEALRRLKKVTQWLLAKASGECSLAGACAHDYMHMFGYSCFSYMWALMASASLQKAGNLEDAFYQGKILKAQFYNSKILPMMVSLEARIYAEAQEIFTLKNDHFEKL